MNAIKGGEESRGGEEGVSAGQGACCQKKSQPCSELAAELRAFLCFYTATQGHLFQCVVRKCNTNLDRDLEACDQ